MSVLDLMGDFQRRSVICRRCGWSGRGAAMAVGETFDHGCDFHCPSCDSRYGFVQWPVIIRDDAPPDWPSKVPPVKL